jgi:NADH-quinone oxidoreductase subunit L
MILGLGVGSWTFALYHLLTHAFFKCCLFQCSGSVIHGAHHQQDMRYYGGLWKKMPITGACYLLATFAIAGAALPGLAGVSGFYSKDGIIASAWFYGQAMQGLGGPWATLFYWGPAIVAYITAFYMARSFALTFLGKPRDQHLYDHAHEAPWQMWVPQVVLALMTFAAAPWAMGFWVNMVHSSAPHVAWVLPGTEAGLEHGYHFVHAWVAYGWIIGIGLGIALYYPGMAISSRIAALPGVNLIHKWWLNKFYFDALYDIFTVNVGKTLALLAGAFDKYIVDGLVNLTGMAGKAAAWAAGLFDNRVVDGAVNGAALATQNGGDFLRATQPGRVRAYVLVLFASAAVVMLTVVIVAVVNG